MKIKFLATNKNVAYTIDAANEVINGLDLSVIEYVGKFTGDETTKNAGIRDAYRDENGELWVTLEQAPPITKMSFKIEGRKVPITFTNDAYYRIDDSNILYIAETTTVTDEDGNSGDISLDKEVGAVERSIEHRGGDWTESDWINASTFDPEQLYIKEVV